MKNIAIFILFIVLSSCAGNQSLPPQEMVDIIRVEQNYPKKDLAIIQDKEKVKAVIDFVNSKQDGWSIPWYGPPVGKVYLKLYKEEKFVGNFYVGPYFFGRDFGNFWSQSASKAEIASLGSLLGVNLLELISAAE